MHFYFSLHFKPVLMQNKIKALDILHLKKKMLRDLFQYQLKDFCFVFPI